MKRNKIIAVALVLSASAALAQKPTGEKQDQIIQKIDENNKKIDEMLSKQSQLEALYASDMNMNDEITKMSYAYGVTLADGLRAQGINSVDYSALVRGIYDTWNGIPTAKMDLVEAQKYLNEIISQMMAEKARLAKEKGEKFLAENAKKSGVKTTESGLQYEVLKLGTGEKPTKDSKVTVHYHGTTTDGKVFDSSVERGKPATFGLSQVIRGWTEGLQLMPIGSKYRFYLPSDLAYGERGAGGAIGPNEVLIFEVELISIEK